MRTSGGGEVRIDHPLLSLDSISMRIGVQNHVVALH
jgi:hypothetical protein